MSIPLPVKWLSIVDAPPGPAWRIVEIELMQDSVLCRTQTCRQGQALPAKVRQTWPVNESETHTTELKGPEYGIGVATYDWVQGGGSVFLEGRDGHGPLNYEVLDSIPSDQLRGVGLPEARHIGVRVVFERQEGTTPPTPPPTPGALIEIASEVDAAKRSLLQAQEHVDVAALLVAKLRTQ